ncbi:MAG: TonB-dependent receptor domain-containing protein [Cryomorphaceae bacterium]|nr:TonB-dependent receptor [Flavobacteriales bacterium]
MQRIFYFVILSLFYAFASAQETGAISGVVFHGNAPLPYAQIALPGTALGAVADEDGRFHIAGLEPGSYKVEARMMGFKTQKANVELKGGENRNLEFHLQEDQVNLNTLVVSGSRSEVPVFDAPVIVSQISEKTFAQTQSQNLAEGLAYSPGLRVETNCQNCGFTQVRMNGLDGAYSQILVNSRPVFSALTGVYGLDLIPANMIDRVEVVRGGGSALYGGNAIGGTVNIITRTPVENSFNVGINQAFTNGNNPDRTISVNGTAVSDDLKKGISIYGFNRSRNPWDANADGFSELVKLENTTFGMDAFLKPGERQKLEFNFYAIDEYRRGGNKFHLEPHQADIAEELKHRILGGGLNFEHYSKDYRHKFEVYASGQYTNRDSYYGAGGRVIAAGDSITEADVLALNAYGATQDLSLMGGIQYDFSIADHIELTAGSEYLVNSVSDEMPGYRRTVDQTISTFGNFAQVDIDLSNRLSFLMGGRLDVVDISSSYRLADFNYQGDTTMVVALPRFTAMYDLSDRVKLRGSFAQGYRAPQAFNEDLHIQTVGGAPRFSVLDKGLKAETSNAFTLSVNYMEVSDQFQLNAVLEGFRNALLNPFITSNPTELENGTSVVRTRNGDGATVQGANLEVNLSLRNTYFLQLGFTAQSARYKAPEEIWSADNDAGEFPTVTTKRMLRTPNAYGYFSLGVPTLKNLELSLSGVYTGSMKVPHVIDVDTEFTTIKTTPDFMEVNTKLTYTINLANEGSIEIFGGIQNVGNAYQSDLDVGTNRDADYVYGPGRPRTYFLGLSYGINNK